MSILNEVRQILYENNLVQLVPTVGSSLDNPTGRIEIDNSYVQKYSGAIRDCSEYRTIDDAVEGVFKGINAVDLIPCVDKTEPWTGGFVNGSELKPGVGGVATLGLRKGSDMVSNAYLKIDLYKTTSDEYEIASEIVLLVK